MYYVNLVLEALDKVQEIISKFLRLQVAKVVKRALRAVVDLFNSEEFAPLRESMLAISKQMIIAALTKPLPA